MKKLCCLSGALMLLACVVNAGGAGLERRDWKLPLKKGAVLSVKNHYGDIRLRKGGREPELEVFAVFQQLRSDGVRLEAQIREDGFFVDWAHKPSKEAPPRPVGDRSRVDLVLRVPEGTRLRVETEDGLIEAKGIHGDLDLRSRGGEIRFDKIHGSVQAENEGGSILGVLIPDAPGGRQSFRTVTGEIGLWFPPTVGRTILLRTSGKITTDFSLEIEHHDGEEPEKYARAELGGGGPEILLFSRIGNLSIRRLAAVLKSEPEETEKGGAQGEKGDAAAAQGGTPLATESGTE